MDGDKLERRSVAPEEEGRPVASFAHEINNPLDSLLNLLFLIEAEPTLTNKARHYLALAREEALRVSQIVHAAMNRLRDSTARERANVPELLRSVVEFYQSRFDSRNISVNTRYCPDGDLPVYSGQLRQTFSNLLLNAVDAMPKGGTMYARVSMAHEWMGQERSGLRITFADNGSGIKQDDLLRMTEPFFTTKGSAGNGLGLSLVKDTVQKHGGALRVRSSTRPGCSGTVFAIFLPA